MDYFNSAEFYPEPPRIHRVNTDIYKNPGESLDRLSWDNMMMRKYGWNSHSKLRRFLVKENFL